MIQPTSEEQCLLHISNVHEVLQQAPMIPTDNLEMLTTYLQELIAIQALITETHASIKFILLNKREEALNKMLKSELEGVKKDGTVVVLKVAPSVQKMFAECRAKEYEYLYQKTDRLCANVSHAIEAVRTLISNAKQEKYFTQTQN